MDSIKCFKNLIFDALIFVIILILEVMSLLFEPAEYADFMAIQKIASERTYISKH